jgi:hypothetical protein
MRRLDERAVAALALLATLGLALPLLLEPWGGDTSVFEYIGRHWAHGVWPYGGAHDNKPPGIFAVHALSSLVFGRAMWGYRLVELGALGVLGWLLGRTLRGGSVALRTATGFWLCAAFYFAAFDYWRSAQVELWVALFSTAAWVVVRERPRAWGAQLAAGLLLGIAFLFKFPALLLALGVSGVLVRRILSEERAASPRVLFAALARLGAGGLLALALGAAPFAASGNFAAMWEALVPFNRFYLARVDWKDPEATLPEFWLYHAGALTLLAVVVGALALRRAKHDPRLRSELGEIAALLALALASTLIQDKLLAYYWATALPFVVVWVLCATWQLFESVQARAGLVLLSGALVVLGTPLARRPPGEAWEWRPPPVTSVWRASVAYALGRLEREQYLARFSYLYPQQQVDSLARIVRAAAQDGDTLCVHDAFLPPLYTLTGLSCPSRFFSDHLLRFIQSAAEPPAGVADWESEHERALEQHPPTLVVMPLEPGELELWGHEYRSLATVGNFSVLRLSEPLRATLGARGE